jgi:hypothetical protein
MRTEWDSDGGHCPETGLESSRVFGTPSSAPIRRVALGSISAFAVYVSSVGLTYCALLWIARMRP